MNIEQLIADLRARVNPQYYDQVGTESYERHQCVMALESLLARIEVLRVQNAALRADAARIAASFTRCRYGVMVVGNTRISRRFVCRIFWRNQMSLFRRLFGCRRYRTVRIYKGFAARRVACTHCGRNYVMHAPTRSFLPWDDEFADMYEDWT